jgi:ATP-binding cassette subfamily F protein 3
MGSIFVDGLKKYFGVDAVIENASFNIGTYDKVALVGQNGCGKSTLIKILMGEVESDGGSCIFEPNKRVGYFAQDRSVDVSEKSVIGYIREAFEKVNDLAQKIDAIHIEIENNPQDQELLSKLEKLHHEYEALGGYELDHKIDRILTGLGFTKADWQRHIISLSGGERSRLYLSRILASEPDTLVLDEPTNHLDLDSIMWLEEFLANFNGSVLIVSHDRYLLDKVCPKTIILMGGKTYQYHCNFTFARQQYRQERELELFKLDEQKEFLDRAKRYIQRFKGIGTEIASKKAKNMERRVDRLEDVNVRPREDYITLDINSSGRSGEIVFRTKNLSKGFETKSLLENVDIELKYGQKVALMGPNGCGKTTFIRMVMGDVEPTAGEIWVGPSVEPIYLEQELGGFDPEKTVLKELMDSSDLNIPEARDHLATFLFTGDDVFKKCSVLSGGETSRLIMSKLALISANFLVFDEPTNHLDINARMALEETLRNYRGSIFLVSHDRYFIKNIDARIWVLENKTIKDTGMNLEQYLESRQNTKSDKPKQKTAEKPAQKATVSKNKLRSIKEDIEKIESTISQFESEKTSLEQAMSNSDFYGRGAKTVGDMDRYEMLKKEIPKLEARWEELSENLESLSH